MNRIEKLRKIKVFKSLPYGIQLISLYHNWVMFDFRKTGAIDSFEETFQMRQFLIQIYKSMDIDFSIVPTVNEENYLSTWFRIRKELDIESVKEMDHDFYEIKRRYNGYSAVEIKRDTSDGA